MNKWSDFFENELLVKQLVSVGYPRPTPVQMETLKYTRKLYDLVIAAPTVTP